MTEELGVWTVLWQHQHQSCLLDFDDESAARKCGVILAETGRDDVFVSGPQLAELSKARADAIGERVYAATLGREIDRNVALKAKIDDLELAASFDGLPMREVAG
jgi:hypothetical protein